ncbi:hypothetical protein AOLI_G00329740 [Acnodon oligacanthus]
MEGGTAPGIDGLPVEFYKAFWAELGADWLAVLNEALVEGSLPLSCRRAVISLLPKKGDLLRIGDQDVLEVSNILDVDSGFISLDQEKAFDRVEHQYLWYTLEAFGFSPYFITMVRVLFQDVESVLKINGGLSAPFRAERGIRQGCALSGMLYCLAIEPLLNRLHSKIEGFALPQHDVQHCISAYADDVMVMGKQILTT